MAFLFKRQRSALDIVRSTKDLLHKLERGDGQQAKVEEDLTKNLKSIKESLQGTPDQNTTPDAILDMVTATLSESLLSPLVASIPRLPFESRKDTQAIISNVFRYRHPESQSNEPYALAQVIQKQPELIIQLCNGYKQRESANACGGILKEALKWDAVAAIILYDESGDGVKTVNIFKDVDVTCKSSGRGVFWSFFRWINESSFEVAADAFDCFRLILTKHKPLVSQYLLTNFDRFFEGIKDDPNQESYNRTLIDSPSYVTKRQSLKLLGEMLLDRQFYEVMTRYVHSRKNLELIMRKLKDESKMVKYESFHVFKIFAANPNKSAEVENLLIANKEKLLNFLPKFLDDRTDDDQFNDEKAWLIKAIGKLPDPPNRSRAGASGQGNSGVSMQQPNSTAVRS